MREDNIEMYLGETDDGCGLKIKTGDVFHKSNDEL